MESNPSKFTEQKIFKLANFRLGAKKNILDFVAQCSESDLCTWIERPCYDGVGMHYNSYLLTGTYWTTLCPEVDREK